MPELPEVEIAVRRIGAVVESALAPGMNVMKTFEPALDELVGKQGSELSPEEVECLHAALRVLVR